jgi:serine O-acetyltransferase
MKNKDEILTQFFRKEVEILLEQCNKNSILTELETEELRFSLHEATKIDSTVLQLVLEDMETLKKKDPALAENNDWREMLLYSGLKVRFFHEVAHSFYCLGKTLQARVISEAVKNITHIEVHPGAKIGKRMVIDHGMGIVIGETAEIGDDVLIFHGVSLGGIGNSSGKRHPTIGNNVLLGAHSQILGAINVGNNAKIGANSTVLRDVPADSTFVGVLATVKKINN